MVVAAAQRMVARGIGALVVSEDGKGVVGLLSERDAARGLAKHGARLLNMRVREVMTSAVPACSPNDTIASAMAEMTRSRNRHLPVVEDGKLCELISVGDVVKQRLGDLELEAMALRDVRHRFVSH